MVVAKLMLAAAGALFAASSAGAEIVSSSPEGFALEISVETSVPPERAFATLGEIGTWWSSEHTYSGDAGNMTLDLTAGGCFCERWDEGSIEHAHVVQVRDEAVLRMTGGLGPLQALPVVQVHDWTVERTDTGARIIYATRVSGDPADKLAELAPVVDMVMTEQMTRLETYLAGEAP